MARSTIDKEQRGAAAEALRKSLWARGQRVTPQRLAIHAVLHDLGRHVTAEEVHSALEERLPGVSMPTVYATLDLLDELGIARRISPGEGPVLYDPRPEPHHHTVCERCGAIEDLYARVDAGNALAAARSAGFDARHADVVLRGLCRSCRAGRGPASST